MIVAVCADKGSPGVTTAAVALALTWPGRRVVLEADPSGGDLAFRARNPQTGTLLRADPGLLTLAADARTGLAPDAVPRYAQPTLWGIDVVPGPPSASAYAPMRSLWPAVADAAAAWSGTVIADLGRLYPGSPATVVAQAATVVLLLTRVSVEGLYHLRDRLPELAARFGDPSRPVHPVAVVPVARRRDATAAARQVARVVESVGSPVPVLGTIAIDPFAAQRLREGQISPRVARGDLLRSTTDLAARIGQRWPDLAPASSPAVAAEVVAP